MRSGSGGGQGLLGSSGVSGLRLAKGRGMHTVYSIVLKYETTLNAGTGCERPNPSKRVARAHPLAQVEPE